METDGVIDLGDVGEDAVDALLVWLYTLDYDHAEKVIHACATKQAKLGCAMELVILAHDMDLRSIVDHARGTFAELFRDYLETAVSPRDDWEEGEGAVFVMVRDVARVVGDMYGEGRHAAVVGSRACIMQYLAARTGRLLQEPAFVGLLKEEEALMTDLMMQLVLMGIE